MAVRVTLRFKIIESQAFFILLLIAAFAGILLWHQVRVIEANNWYRARVGSFMAKGALERNLLIALIRGSNPSEAFQKLIPLLKEGRLTEEIFITDPEGRIICASQAHRVGERLPELEARWAETSRKMYSPQNWFYTQQQAGELLMFTPITIDDVPQYVALFRYSQGNVTEAFRQILQLFLLLALLAVIFGAILCLVQIRSVLGPIRILNDATKEIAAGNLGLKVEVPTEDELGELAGTFNGMTSALVKMKERAENANPLTKLPGNNMIHEEIEKRIKGKKKFVAVYSDLDNFKAFNDKYGIGAGDQAIKLAAQIMREAIKKGDPGDFLGHEGGDDFILLTTPEKAEAVTSHLCTEFDKRIKELYSPEDRERGTIVSKDREGNVKQFALMTFSLAGVTNAHRELTSYAEVTNICAEVKKKAKISSKTSGKSCFVLDKRTGEESPTSEPH